MHNIDRTYLEAGWDESEYEPEMKQMMGSAHFI
jgi:hypothetical protein